MPAQFSFWMELRLPKPVIFALIALLFSVLSLHIMWWTILPPDKLLTEDIFYAWQEGTYIADGINPYESSTDGNIKRARKINRKKFFWKTAVERTRKENLSIIRCLGKLKNYKF